LKRKSEIMMKQTLIAAATAAALFTPAIATAAPTAAPSGYLEVHGPGQWNGSGNWQKNQKFGWSGKSCQPIVRWKLVGHHYRRHWQPVVVGWDCDFGHRHHRQW
jgi:hypothetical protein